MITIANMTLFEIMITNKQINKQTNKQTNKYIAKTNVIFIVMKNMITSAKMNKTLRRFTATLWNCTPIGTVFVDLSE